MPCAFLELNWSLTQPDSLRQYHHSFLLYFQLLLPILASLMTSLSQECLLPCSMGLIRHLETTSYWCQSLKTMRSTLNYVCHSTATILNWDISTYYNYTFIAAANGIANIQITNLKICAELSIQGDLKGINLKFYGMSATLGGISTDFSGDLIFAFCSFMFNHFKGLLQTFISIEGVSLLNLSLIHI